MNNHYSAKHTSFIPLTTIIFQYASYLQCTLMHLSHLGTSFKIPLQ